MDINDVNNINEPKQGIGLNVSYIGGRSHLQHSDRANRLPWARKLSDNVRNSFVAMSGEFVGTVLFLFFAFAGTQVANNVPSTLNAQSFTDPKVHVPSGTVGPPIEAGANPAQLLYIALSFGFSLAVNVWIFYRISGGLFNPAVTVGLCLVGAVRWKRGALLFVAQVLGGIVAAAIVDCLFPGPLTVTVSLGGGTSITQGLFIEMFLTAELVFTIFMLAAEKHRGTFIAPIGIGLALFIAHLTGVYFTGAGINPTRAFGPAVVTRTFPGYHWIYWLGPFMGALVASGLYRFMKIMEYETANPGQDYDKEESTGRMDLEASHLNR